MRPSKKKPKQFRVEVERKKNVPTPMEKPVPINSTINGFDDSKSSSKTKGFRELGLHPLLCKSCEKAGFSTPTKIQEKSLPLALRGENVIGASETGTGKTACFVLPILHSLLTQKKKVSPCSALILAPSRELCMQLEERVKMLGECIGIRTACLIGGVESVLQETEIKKGPQIVVGTPGRVVYFLENCGSFNLHRCKMLCIDECDVMLGVKFKNDLDTILNFFKEKVKAVQKLVFTATMTKKIWKLQKLHLTKNVQFVDCSARGRFSTVKNLTQKYLLIPEKFKEVYLCYLLNELSGKRIIVFVGQNSDSLRLTIILRAVGFPAVPLTSMMNEEHRLKCLKSFRNGDYPIMVATDVSSRGLDIENVDVVVNYDIPTNPKDYVHRTGRTARMGREGLALTIITQYDIEYFQRIEKLIGEKMSEFEVNKNDAMVLVSTVSKAMKMARNRMKYNEKDNDMQNPASEEEVIIDNAIGSLKRKRESSKKKRKRRRKR